MLSGVDMALLMQILDQAKTKHTLGAAADKRFVVTGASRKTGTDGNGKVKKPSAVIPMDKEDFNDF